MAVYSRRTKWALQLLSFSIFLAAWQYFGTRPDAFAVAPPTKVFPELVRIILSGEILKAAAGTLQAMTLGFILATIVGIAVGVIVALTDFGFNTLEPLVDALYAAPISLLIPILGVYIGLDFQGRVFLVFAWTVFSIIINTIAGVRSTPPELLEMARSFNAS